MYKAYHTYMWSLMQYADCLKEVKGQLYNVAESAAVVAGNSWVKFRGIYKTHTHTDLSLSVSTWTTETLDTCTEECL